MYMYTYMYILYTESGLIWGTMEMCPQGIAYLNIDFGKGARCQVGGGKFPSSYSLYASSITQLTQRFTIIIVHVIINNSQYAQYIAYTVHVHVQQSLP